MNDATGRSPSCADCLFYQKLPQTNTGWCHRYPPVVALTMGNNPVWMQRRPVVTNTEFCGEFSPSGKA